MTYGTYWIGVRKELAWLIRPPRQQLNSISVNGFVSLGFFVGSLALGTNNPHVLPIAATVILLWTLADASLTNQFMYDKRRTAAQVNSKIKLKQVLIVRNVTIAILCIPLSILFGLLMVAIVGKWSELIFGLIMSLALVWGWLGICNVMSVYWPFEHMETKLVIKRQPGWLKFVILYCLPWVILPCYALLILLPLKLADLIADKPHISKSAITVVIVLIISIIIWQIGLSLAEKHAEELRRVVSAD